MNVAHYVHEPVQTPTHTQHKNTSWQQTEVEDVMAVNKYFQKLKSNNNEKGNDELLQDRTQLKSSCGTHKSLATVMIMVFFIIRGFSL